MKEKLNQGGGRDRNLVNPDKNSLAEEDRGKESERGRELNAARPVSLFSLSLYL